MSTPDTQQPPPPGTSLATTAEALYLINLMLAPGLAFLVLAWLWHSRRKHAPALALNHLEQTFFVSLWGGALLVIVNALMILFGGYDQPWTWVVVILYFTMVHTTLIFFGAIGLSRAMAGKFWRIPVIGPHVDE